MYLVQGVISGPGPSVIDKNELAFFLYASSSRIEIFDPDSSTNKLPKNPTKDIYLVSAVSQLLNAATFESLNRNGALSKKVPFPERDTDGHPLLVRHCVEIRNSDSALVSE